MTAFVNKEFLNAMPSSLGEKWTMVPCDEIVDEHDEITWTYTTSSGKKKELPSAKKLTLASLRSQAKKLGYTDSDLKGRKRNELVALVGK